MAYSKVQFYGMIIDTFGATSTAGKKYYHGYSSSRFAPSSWDFNAEQADFAKRLAVFSRALHAARYWQYTDPNMNVLKVFMVPEFFFRGPTGAYSFDMMSHALSEFATLAGDVNLSDWFFVFGSVVSTIMHNNRRSVANVSYCGRGGANCTLKGVYKKLVSGIDFIKRADRLSPNLVALEDVTVLPLKNTGDQRAMIPFDTRKVGVEICLDHHENVQRIKTTLDEEHSYKLDVQLIPSAGMSIKVPSVMTKQGGYVFNCDGIRKAADLKTVASEGGWFSNPSLTDVGGATRITAVAAGQDNDSNDVFSGQAIEIDAFKPLSFP